MSIQNMDPKYVNWEYIVQNEKLTENDIEKYGKYLNWDDVCMHQKLSEDFIERHSDKLEWTLVSTCQELSEEFITKHKDKVDWYAISRYQKLSEDFIKKFQYNLTIECIDSTSLAVYDIRSKHFVKENFTKVYKDIPEYLIENNQDKCNWDEISSIKDLPEDFIDKYKHNLNWFILSANNEYFNSNFNEEFIIKYKKYIRWHEIKKLKLTPDIAKQCSREIIWTTDLICKVLESDQMSVDEKMDVQEHIKWDFIGSYNMPIFMVKFQNIINWTSLTKSLAVKDIRYYCNKLSGLEYRIDWEVVSSNVKELNVTKKFLEDYKDYLNWDIVSEKLPINKIVEFELDRINFDIVVKRKDLSAKFINKYKDKIDLSAILNENVLVQLSNLIPEKLDFKLKNDTTCIFDYILNSEKYTVTMKIQKVEE